MGTLACLTVGWVLFAWLLYRTAWVSDDAFISLRTVSNLLNGYGLRWNVSERVQTFTHPLWLFALTGAHAITGEPFYSTLYLSWIVSTVAIGALLVACPGQLLAKMLALFVLAFSQAFVDFSSSGLENPFTHLFVVTFVVVYVRTADMQRRALWLSVIAGLAAFNRLDTSLLFAPAMAHALWTTRREVPLGYYLVGALPLLGWEVFSLLYYGFLFPNTAYAKLAQDQSPSALITALGKGFEYLLSSVRHDPLTLATIGGALALVMARPYRHVAWLALGAAAYLLYVVRIGGDFMGGRFLSAPLFLSCACWVAASPAWRWAAQGVVTVGLVALASLGQFAPPFTGLDFKLRPGESEVDEYGIHNERRLFFTISSLRNASVMNPVRPDHPWSRNGYVLRWQSERSPQLQVDVIDAIGYVGYFAGPKVHIVDHWALADALIARLPPVSGQYGHYPRVIPEGYIASLSAQDNLLPDVHLRRYYRELTNVIRGPLFDPVRLRSIWRLSTGQLASELDQYAYIRGNEVVISLRFTNPTSYPSVATYVWNADRTTAYALDGASKAGASYSLIWRVSPHGAKLLQPNDAPKATEFQELADAGFFSIAIALSDRVGGPIRDLHELRYTYRRTAEGFIVQRHPWAVWIEDFPIGPWKQGYVPGVLLDVQTHQ